MIKSAQKWIAIRPAAWRLARSLLAILLVVSVLPYLLAPLYRWIDPVSTLMLARWATGKPVQRVWTPLDRVSPTLPLAVIMAEDTAFCSHRGVDFRELRQAIEEADDLREARGGSTLTQQLAKNLFLWPGRSFLRKALEFPLALWLDLVLPKARLMEIYLNVAQWGPNGEFGAEAGARRAFGKAARDVTSREAALLAAILPNPIRRSARQPTPGLRRLAGIYQARVSAIPSAGRCLRRTKAP